MNQHQQDLFLNNNYEVQSKTKLFRERKSRRRVYLVGISVNWRRHHHQPQGVSTESRPGDDRFNLLHATLARISKRVKLPFCLENYRNNNRPLLKKKLPGSTYCSTEPRHLLRQSIAGFRANLKSPEIDLLLLIVDNLSFHYIIY